MDALRNAAKELLRARKELLREVVRGLDAAALNWVPVAGANSIAQLVAHALDAERFLLATAVDVPLTRDRAAQFQVTAASAEELLASIDRVEREVESYLDQLSEAHGGAAITRVEPTWPVPSLTHTGAWWLLHGIEHTSEHLGQALLTRQLYEAQPAGHLEVQRSA